MPVVDSESRVEDILNVELGNLEPSVLQPPQSRVEALLMEIYNGGGGGGKLPIHICTSDEYDHETGVPTVVNPEENTFYLVPDGSGNNLYSEWIYTNNAWEYVGGGSIEIPVTDVQVNGTSVVGIDGVANVPLADNSGTPGAIKIYSSYGVSIGTNDYLRVNGATETEIKAGVNNYKPIIPAQTSPSAFYGLAKAAGDTSQASSSNAVGIYTDNAKTAIKTMLGVNDGMNVVTVTGTSPTITAEANTQYICGEVLSLSFTPSAGGVCDVIFTSGSSLPVLTLPNTVIMPEWFELETNRIYEISISDGVYGAVMSWPTT